MEKIEKHIVELAGEIQKTLGESLRNTIEELMKKNKQDSNRSPKNKSFNTNEQECTQVVRYFVLGDKNLNYPHFASETALSRVDFPRFSGKNVRSWISQCETYFLCNGIPVEFKVELVNIHFEERTLQWHDVVKSN
ncbi:hypothetical protein Lal_00049783 [Lupinus albus]|nr:hypothetical protein Lal_00049783 [Lupinus albus]